MVYDTQVAMSREEPGKNNSCTREEVILQYRPVSEFLFPLVWEGRSVVVIQVVSLNFRLLHVTHRQTVGKLLLLLHVTHTHTVEKLRMLLRAYYNKELIKLDFNT